MANDLTFLDLVLLEKIHDDAVMETFSGMIGTSFFETAEVMGKMKLKGLIDIKPTIGKSTLKRTEAGEQTLRNADTKAQELLDELDHILMKTIASGVNEFGRMQNQLNVRSEDLAYRVYKVTKQGYADYAVKDGKTYFSLTENGFKLTGVVPKAKTAQIQLTGIIPAAPPSKEKSPKETSKEKGIALVMGEEDATKRLPETKGQVDIKQKHSELQFFRLVKMILAIAIIAGIAYFAAKYFGYL